MNVKRKTYKVPQIFCQPIRVECGFAVSYYDYEEVYTDYDTPWTDNTDEMEL